jgi:hypothetical protein
MVYTKKSDSGIDFKNVEAKKRAQPLGSALQIPLKGILN